MSIAMLMLLSLLFVLTGVNSLLGWLAYNRLSQLILMNGLYKADDMARTVQMPKTKRPVLPAKKEQQRGRQVTKTDDLVDIADMPWEDAYKALEELGDGQSHG